MSDVIAELVDLHKQATTEHSHFYVAKCINSAISEITIMREAMQEFVDRRDNGQIQSTYTYNKFKKILNNDN